MRGEEIAPTLPPGAHGASDQAVQFKVPRRRLRSWSSVVSRPALIEFGVLIGLAVSYNFIRAGQDDDVAAAFANAREIVSAERFFFDAVELPLNEWLASVTLLAVPACYFYAVFHYLVTPTIVVRSWRTGGWFHRRGYWSLVLASAIALVMYAKFPVAPPRLMPDLGTIDVMRAFADYGWWGDAASAPRAIGDATNQYAAMPSLHFGWSLWCGIQMWQFGSRRWRVAAVVYPTLQAMVVIATANHFVLDVIGGAAVVLVAFGVVSGVGRLAAAARTAREVSEEPSVV